ncbi:MAG: caspase domain-containing protein [Sulfitobacter sp.]
MAETRALLIGVSDYEDASGIVDLKGPRNDVVLLRDTLQARGISDIRVLADGVGDAPRPTRTAILGALDILAATAQDGDFIYVHLSGHGTRQRDQNDDETDGLDEVFLPADTKRAGNGQKTIPNAITDDEIGNAVHRMRAKGADVWLVMDACHAGSGVRTAGMQTAARFVDPAVLGISVQIDPRPEAEIVEAPALADTPGSGGFVAFYAARSTEVAREVNLARAGQSEAWYGLFSGTLAARLQANTAVSFRQLFQGVLSDMNADHIPGGARLQTPSWEGPLIDAAVFGGAETKGVRRFGVEEDALSAGLVHGISEGTLVGLVADAADAPEAIIGYAQTEDTGPTQSFLRPVSAECVPQSDQPCAALGTPLPSARYAQIVARPIDTKTKLNHPRDLLTGETLAADHPAMVALLAGIETVNAGKGPGLVLSETGFSVDIMWDGTSLWFGPRILAGDTPIGLSWTPAQEDIAPVLARIAGAEALARMLTSVAQNSSPLVPNPVDVSARLSPVDIDDLAAVGRAISPRRECTKAVTRRPAHATRPLTAGADLKQCDQLHFSVQGETAGERDVNRVHIDANFCIFASYERIEGTAAPRRLGPDMTLCSDCPSGDGAGEERLFVITTQGKANTEALNLEGLIENCGGTRDGTARGPAEATQAAAFLRHISSRPDTRGSMAGFDISGIWVETYHWRVLPRREAFRQAGRDVQN